MKDPELRLKLIPSVNSLAKVSQLITELEFVEEFFLKIKVKTSLSQVSLPKVSSVMDELTKINNLNLIKAEDRNNLGLFLHYLKTKAPTVHISFASAPDEDFISKIANWFRTQINPYLMLSIGLQPNIGAGFRLRTINKAFDFSLHKYLVEGQKTLSQTLGQVTK